LIDSPVPISFIVLTFNEEKNLDACLSSVAGWAGKIFVVDSGSTDHTLEIAKRYGARIFCHPFETHAKQWKWVLENLPITTNWVLALDADQRATTELREEISNFLQNQNETSLTINGCYVRRRQIFRGKWIKHGGYYPKYLLKLFRRDAVLVDEGDLVDHHFRVGGNVIKLGSDVIEDNQNEADISVWIAKHNRYAVLQAQEEVRQRKNERQQHITKSFFGTPDQRILWLKQLWTNLPLYGRPFIYFLYRYFFRFGFLDGKEGFIFHFLQAYWYRLLVDIKIDEIRGKEIEADKQYAEASLTNKPQVK
jgi:glycosyltransferase involved in cell wall biosynthesis